MDFQRVDVKRSPWRLPLRPASPGFAGRGPGFRRAETASLRRRERGGCVQLWELDPTVIARPDVCSAAAAPSPSLSFFQLPSPADLPAWLPRPAVNCGDPPPGLAQLHAAELFAPATSEPASRDLQEPWPPAAQHVEAERSARDSAFPASRSGVEFGFVGPPGPPGPPAPPAPPIGPVVVARVEQRVRDYHEPWEEPGLVWAPAC